MRTAQTPPTSLLEPLLRLVANLPPHADIAVVTERGLPVVACGAIDVVQGDRMQGAGVRALRALGSRDPGWWAGHIAFDVGRELEPFRARHPNDASWPLVRFTRFEARARFGPNGQVTFEGCGAGRRMLEQALVGPRLEPALPHLGPWRSSLDARRYAAGVRAVIDLIREGDCYQVNLTRTLTCDRPADPITLFASLARANPAPHATFLRSSDLAIVSASPERFLRIRGRTIETCPIKGTGRDMGSLVASAKDRAENVMIVDLARNDLGRVCEYGSVRVPALCVPQEHPGLVHLVSTVRGTLRLDADLGDVIAATFPPASVTGAPKARVLQRIEELEPVRRGVYCGAVGWVDTDRDEADLAVAIRTFTITDEATHLGVGSGITIDSDPQGEWDETVLKAHRLLAAAGAGSPVAAEALAGVG